MKHKPLIFIVLMLFLGLAKPALADHRSHHGYSHHGYAKHGYYHRHRYHRRHYRPYRKYSRYRHYRRGHGYYYRPYRRYGYGHYRSHHGVDSIVAGVVAGTLVYALQNH